MPLRNDSRPVWGSTPSPDCAAPHFLHRVGGYATDSALVETRIKFRRVLLLTSVAAARSHSSVLWHNENKNPHSKRRRTWSRMTCIKVGSRPGMLSSFTGTLVNMPGCVFSPGRIVLNPTLLMVVTACLQYRAGPKLYAAAEGPRKASARVVDACRRLSNLLRNQNHTRCTSSGKFRNLNITTQLSEVRIDLACNSSHPLDDRKNNRTHPEYRCLQYHYCKCFELQRDGQTHRLQGEGILKLLTRRPVVE